MTMEDEEEKERDHIQDQQGLQSAESTCLVDDDSPASKATIIAIRTIEEWWEAGPRPVPMLVLSDDSPFPSRAASITSDGGSVAASESLSIGTHTSPSQTSGHRRDLRVAHVPFRQLVDEDRSFELPPRNEPFVILVELARLESAARFLIGGAAPPVPLQCGGPKQPRRGGGSWSVAGAILDTPDARALLGELVSSDRYDKVDDSYCLWRPDAMVEHHLLPLLRQSLLHAASTTQRIEVWDLGSGVGRDVAFLARKLKEVHASMAADGPRRPLEFRVVGLDQRYRPRDAAHFRSFMLRQGVDDVTECRLVDLTSTSSSTGHDVSLVREIREGMPACVYSVRYWNRPLFEGVARVAAPGTIVAVTHFAKPAPDSDWPFVHPKEKNVLRRHELSDMFHGTWEVLRDEIATDNDHGRTLLQFVARRRTEHDETEHANAS